MPENRNYYVIADDNTKADAMTKQEILEALQTAIEGKTPKGQLKFPGAIKEINKNRNIKLWTGNEAQYESATLDNDTLALIEEHNDLSSVDEKIADVEGAIEYAKPDHDYSKIIFDGVESSVNENKSNLAVIKANIERSAEIVPILTGEMQNIADGLSDVTESLNASCDVIAPYAEKASASAVLIDMFDIGLVIHGSGVDSFYLSENWTNFKKFIFVFKRNGTIQYKILNFPQTLNKQQTVFMVWSHDEDTPEILTGIEVYLYMEIDKPDRVSVEIEVNNVDLKLMGVLAFGRK